MFRKKLSILMTKLSEWVFVEMKPKSFVLQKTLVVTIEIVLRIVKSTYYNRFETVQNSILKCVRHLEMSFVKWQSCHEWVK